MRLRLAKISQARGACLLLLYTYIFFVFASMIREKERDRAAETRHFLVPGVQSFFLYIYVGGVSETDTDED